MNFAFLTDVGQLRPCNEDNGGIFAHPKTNQQLLAVVADGMGGHNAGDVASKMTSELFAESWETTEPFNHPTEAEQWLVQTIERINANIFAHATKNQDYKGMGTTVVALIATTDFITFAHIGDSRGYLFNERGFVQKTVDHSLVNELVRTGQITDEEAEHHPRKNVLLRALGTEETISVDCSTMIWEKGNYVLLCSDGLSNKINPAEMAEFLSEEAKVEEKVAKLVQTANERGGEDNITVAVIHYTEDGSEDECRI